MLLRLLRRLRERLRGPWVAPDPAEAGPVTVEVQAPPAPAPALLELWRQRHRRPGETEIHWCGHVASVAEAERRAEAFGRGVFRVCTPDGRELACWARRETAPAAA